MTGLKRVVQRNAPGHIRPATRTSLAGLVAISIAVGLAYVIFVPRGLPDDEGPHYATVLYYSEHPWTMPVLGQPEVTHEGYSGPIYYSVAAAVVRATRWLGPLPAFYAVRAANLLLLPLAVILAYRLATLLRPPFPAIALGSAILFALNPDLLGFGTGVQNDLLAIVFAMWAVYLFVTSEQADELTPRRGALVGLALTLGVLTKPTTVFLVPALVVCAILFRRQRSVAPFLCVLVLTVAAGTLWWFVRNYVTYGDFTVKTALDRVGSFPPASLRTPTEAAERVQAFVSAYWSPAQSFSDRFRTPFMLVIVAWGLMLLSVVGWVRFVRSTRYATHRARSPAACIYGILFLVCCAVYAYTHLQIMSIPPRTTFPTFFVVTAALSWGIAHAVPGRRMFSVSSQVTVMALLVPVLVASHVAVIHSAVEADPDPWPSCYDPVSSSPSSCWRYHDTPHQSAISR